MTPTATQPCTAMDRMYEHRDINRDRFEPCGEPVAELGPCQWRSMGSSYFVDTSIECGGGAEAFAHTKAKEIRSPRTGKLRGLGHDYQGRLVHVTLGPCEECGLSRYEHVDHAHMPRVDGRRLVCAFGDCDSYAPTVTELDVGHEAEVSDG